MKKLLIAIALIFISLSAISQRQFSLKQAESFFYLKKDSIVKLLESKGYKATEKEDETYVYETTDNYQIIVSFKRNDLLAFGWTELSSYCKEVTSEMFESNYFYNGGGEEVNNDKDLAISLIVKPSEDRLYLVLKAR